MVEAEKSAKPVAPNDSPGAIHDLARYDQRVVDPLMVPPVMIVLLLQDPAEPDREPRR